MFNHLNKYRHILLGFLVLNYLFSVFQKPLLEAVHLVGHLPQVIFSDKKIHSYHAHNQQVHQHQLLSTIENQSNTSDEQPQPLSEQNNKKKIEFVQTNLFHSPITTSFFKSEFQYTLPFDCIVFNIIVPPPQFFS